MAIKLSKAYSTSVKDIASVAQSIGKGGGVGVGAQAFGAQRCTEGPLHRITPDPSRRSSSGENNARFPRGPRGDGCIVRDVANLRRAVSSSIHERILSHLVSFIIQLLVCATG